MSVTRDEKLPTHLRLDAASNGAGESYARHNLDGRGPRITVSGGSFEFNRALCEALIEAFNAQPAKATL